MRYGYTFMWVSDVPATVEFYEKALGMTRKVMMENGEDGWYAELNTGDTTLGIADIKEAKRIMANVGVRPLDPHQAPNAFQLSFVTDDVAGAVTAAVHAGATLQQEPEDKPWGQTIARVVDPNGVFLSLVTEPPTFG